MLSMAESVAEPVDRKQTFNINAVQSSTSSDEVVTYGHVTVLSTNHQTRSVDMYSTDSHWFETALYIS